MNSSFEFGSMFEGGFAASAPAAGSVRVAGIAYVAVLVAVTGLALSMSGIVEVLETFVVADKQVLEAVTRM